MNQKPHWRNHYTFGSPKQFAESLKILNTFFEKASSTKNETKHVSKQVFQQFSYMHALYCIASQAPELVSWLSEQELTLCKKLFLKATDQGWISLQQFAQLPQNTKQRQISSIRIHPAELNKQISMGRQMAEKFTSSRFFADMVNIARCKNGLPNPTHMASSCDQPTTTHLNSRVINLLTFSGWQSFIAHSEFLLSTNLERCASYTWPQGKAELNCEVALNRQAAFHYEATFFLPYSLSHEELLLQIFHECAHAAYDIFVFYTACGDQRNEANCAKNFAMPQARKEAIALLAEILELCQLEYAHLQKNYAICTACEQYDPKVPGALENHLITSLPESLLLDYPQIRLWYSKLQQSIKLGLLHEEHVNGLFLLCSEVFYKRTPLSKFLLPGE